MHLFHQRIRNPPLPRNLVDSQGLAQELHQVRSHSPLRPQLHSRPQMLHPPRLLLQGDLHRLYNPLVLPMHPRVLQMKIMTQH